MIYLEERHLNEVRKILSSYPYTFYAFGSRTKRTHKKLSDLDICYKDAIPTLTVAEIREKFDESSLPFKVDLVDFNHASPEFQKAIENDLVKISTEH
jgi:predicted nucleotidyltransferase